MGSGHLPHPGPPHQSHQHWLSQGILPANWGSHSHGHGHSHSQGLNTGGRASAGPAALGRGGGGRLLQGGATLGHLGLTARKGSHEAWDGGSPWLLPLSGPQPGSAPPRARAQPSPQSRHGDAHFPGPDHGPYQWPLHPEHSIALGFSRGPCKPALAISAHNQFTPRRGRGRPARTWAAESRPTPGGPAPHSPASRSGRPGDGSTLKRDPGPSASALHPSPGGSRDSGSCCAPGAAWKR